MDAITISPSSTMIGAAGSSSYVTATVGTGNTINLGKSPESVLDAYDMNQISVEYRITEHELLKLKDTDVSYADTIKSKMTTLATQEVAKKMMFTKKKDIDSDTTSFRGRVYVFTKEELIALIKDAAQ